MSLDVKNLKRLSGARGPEGIAAEEVVKHCLAGKFINVPGVVWLMWDGLFRGLRMALMEETPEDGYFDMQSVESTIGTEYIVARKMRQDDIRFKATHTMWINTNHRPRVSQSDWGTWRRLVSVPWPWTFIGPGREAKNEWYVPGDIGVRNAVADRPSQETQSAVLSWLITGAIRWYQQGMASGPHPKAILDEIEAWRMSTDLTLRFVMDHLIADPRGYIRLSEMNSVLNNYMEEGGRRASTEAKQSERLHEAITQAGLRAEKCKVWKARCDDRESLMDLEGKVRSRPVEANTTYRGWRGIRFKTGAEQAADLLAESPEAC